MTASTEIIRLELPEEMLAICACPLGRGLLGYTKGGQLGRWAGGAWQLLGEYPELYPTEAALSEARDRWYISMYPAPAESGAPLVVLVIEYNTWGLVVEVETGAVVLRLNRVDYHPEQTLFPVVWRWYKGQLSLIHAVDWNELSVSVWAGGQMELIPREKTFEFDYFLGALRLSPAGEWLSTSGWHWGAYVCVRMVEIPSSVYDSQTLNAALETQKHSFYTPSYDWNRPMDWIDEAHLLIWYHTKEEEEPVAESERLQQWGIAHEGAYWLVWSVKEDRVIRSFVCDHYDDAPEYPTNRLWVEGNLAYAFCVVQGLAVYDWVRGVPVARYADVLPPYYWERGGRVLCGKQL